MSGLLFCSTARREFLLLLKWCLDLCWVLLKKEAFNQVFCTYTVQKVAVCSCILLQKAKKVLPSLCSTSDPKLLLDGNWELLSSHGVPSAAFYIEQNTGLNIACAYLCVSLLGILLFFWYFRSAGSHLTLTGKACLNLKFLNSEWTLYSLEIW